MYISEMYIYMSSCKLSMSILNIEPYMHMPWLLYVERVVQRICNIITTITSVHNSSVTCRYMHLEHPEFML